MKMKLFVTGGKRLIRRRTSAIVETLEPRCLLSGVYNFNSIVSFAGASGGSYPAGQLVADSNGDIFGTTQHGGDAAGSAGDGSVFELLSNGNAITLANFNKINGSQPAGQLAIDSAGDVFGMAMYGGTNGTGTIWEIAQGTATITTLVNFNLPVTAIGGIAVDPGGNLFGTTNEGGANGAGMVWEIAQGSNQLTTLASFNGSNGSSPTSNIALDGSDNIFGATDGGGSASDGTVFELASGSNSITTLASFTGTNGKAPTGIVLDSQDNIFGTAILGGANSRGTVFEIAAGSGMISVLANFSSSIGSEPFGTPAMDANGNLFGTSYFGLSYGSNPLWKLPKGSSTLSIVYYFNNTGGSAGNLAFDPNGDLFGTNYASSAKGSIWEIAQGSSTASNVLTFPFTPVVSSSYGDLDFDSSGDAFGTASSGGNFNDGMVFELLQGTNTFIPFVSFNGTNGANPYAGVTFDSAGNIFGTTNGGGSKKDGTVFEIAAGSSTITTVASFLGTNGAHPLGGVCVDNSGNLFGIASNVIFEVVHGSSSITTLAKLSGSGVNVVAGLTMDASEDLFGTTYSSTGGYGSVFELPFGSGSVTTLASFDGTAGYTPWGPVTVDSHGNVFGTTELDPANQSGTVFEITAGNHHFTTLATFSGPNGNGPLGNLALDSNGDIFGSTGGGGANSDGTVFEIAAGSGTITNLLSFSGLNGATPLGGVSLDSAGDIWGTTYSGGTYNAGTLFELVSSPINAKLVVTQQPSLVLAGTTPSQTVVNIEDSSGNTLTGDQSQITLSLYSSANGGTALYMQTVSASNGVATFNFAGFPGSIENTPGTYLIGATDPADSASTVSLTSFTIVPTTYTKLVFTTGPQDEAAGANIPIVVTIEDFYGNVKTGDNSNVTLGTLQGGGILHGTLTVAAFGGIATFNDLSINTTGKYNISASDSETASISSPIFNIIPAAPATLSISSFPHSATAGATLGSVIVKIYDGFNNLETGDNSAVTVTFTGSNNPAPTATVNAVNGVATFSNVILDVADVYILSASDPTDTTLGFSNSVGYLTINSAAASQLVFTGVPSNGFVGSALANVALAIEDQFGNVVTGDNNPVSISVSGGSFSATSSITVNASSGIATFNALVPASVGTYTLSASDNSDGFSSGLSTAINVSGVPSLLFTAAPISTTAGTTLATVTVEILNSSGNLDTGNTNLVSIAPNSGAFAAGSVTSVHASGGVATFSNLVLDGAGNYTLTATDSADGLSAESFSSFTINSAAAAQLAFISIPNGGNAGQPLLSDVIVQVEDQFGNFVSANGLVTLSPSIGSFGSGSVFQQNAQNGVAYFSNLIFDTTGQVQLIATDPSDGINTGWYSNNLTIQAANPSQLVYAQFPTTVPGGTKPQVVVDVKDIYGNLVAGDYSQMTLGIYAASSGGSALYTQTVSVQAGIASFNFSGLQTLIQNTPGTYWIGVSDSQDGLSLSRTSYNVVQAAPAKIVFASVPNNGVVGNPLGQVTVYIEDQFGNLENSDNSLVTISPNSSSFASRSTFSVNASGGVVSFSNLILDTAGNYTLSVTDTTDGLTSLPSSSITVNPAAPFSITYVQQPTNTAAHSAISPGIQVQVADQFGNLLSGTSVALAVATGPSIAISGTTSTITNSSGIATFANISLTTLGGYTLVATDGSASAHSNSFNVVPATPFSITYIQQPNNVGANTVIAPAMQVQIADQYGNLVTGSSVTLAVATGPSTTITGTTTAITNSSGVATFGNISLAAPGSYTFVATYGSASANSNLFTVGPKLVFTQQPQNAAAGAKLAAVKVAVEDSNGIVQTGDSSTVTITVINGIGGVAGTYTAVASKGIATFSSIAITAAANFTLQASDGTDGIAISNGFTISPGPAKKLIYGTVPPTGIAGVVLPGSIVVDVEDTYGNFVATDTSTVALAIRTAPAGGAIFGTASVQAINGVATFSTLYFKTAGGYTLTASDGTLTSVLSSSIKITPAAVASIKFVAQPPTTGTAGTRLASNVTVQALDAYGNAVSGDFIMLSPASGSGVIYGSNSATTAATTGIATFGNLIFHNAGAYTLYATDGIINSANSTSFTILPAAAHNLLFTQLPSGASHGNPFAVQVSVQDAYGNVLTNSSTGTITLALGTHPTGSTLGGTLTANVINGVATFNNLTVNLAGSYTLKASDSFSIAALTSSLFIIS